MTDLQTELTELCTRAVNVYGATAQLRMLQEECGELIAAVSHLERGRIDETEIADEIADVIIMCTQAIAIIGVRHVRGALLAKMRRLRTQVEATEKRLGEP